MFICLTTINTDFDIEFINLRGSVHVAGVVFGDEYLEHTYNESEYSTLKHVCSSAIIKYDST